MSRLAAICLVVLSVLSACEDKSKTAPAPAREAAAAERKAPPPAPEKVAAPAPEKDPEQLVIDSAMLDKYLAAQKEVVAELKKYVEATRADLEKSKGKTGTLDAVGTLTRMGERQKKMEEATDAAIAKAGLTRPQYKQLNDAANDLATELMLYEQAGGEAGVAKMEAEIKAELKGALEKMPEAERAKAETEALGATQAMRDLGNAKGSRKTFGDASVDVLLKRFPEIRAQREELLGLLK